MAKCYYAKKRLVWEILERRLKSKIEIQWNDIIAMRAIIRENQPGILEIEVLFSFANILFSLSNGLSILTGWIFLIVEPTSYLPRGN